MCASTPKVNGSAWRLCCKMKVKSVTTRVELIDIYVATVLCSLICPTLEGGTDITTRPPSPKICIHYIHEVPTVV